MTQSNTKMTRSDMQSEALAIQSRLNAAMALRSVSDPDDEATTIVEMAHGRAARLNAALDSVNALEAVS